MLIGIGVWGLRVKFAEAAETLGRRHIGYKHKLLPLAVETVHGLAGSSHFLGIVPALALPSDLAAIAYLLLFGFGTIAAMGSFSSLIGWSTGRLTGNRIKGQNVLLALFSVVAIIVGGFWLFS